jgi:hypothetical protein
MLDLASGCLTETSWAAIWYMQWLDIVSDPPTYPVAAVRIFIHDLLAAVPRMRAEAGFHPPGHPSLGRNWRGGRHYWQCSPGWKTVARSPR